jgi:hypothetical protein
MKAVVAAWLGATGLGLILLFSGITDSGGNSQPGLIVFGALIVSIGVSGLLGLAHDPDSSGSMFALIGLIVPGYSLPFLLYYAGKGASERAEEQARRRRMLAREQAEREAGLRCSRCGLLKEGRHASWCPYFVHEYEVAVHDSSEWLLTSGVVVPPSRSYSVRCSCGTETARYDSEESAARVFRCSHGDESGLRIVPVVHA